jgi:hypothetical protein
LFCSRIQRRNSKKNKVQNGGLSKNNQWPLSGETNLPPPQNVMNVDGNGEEGMMNMVGHTIDWNEPNVITSVGTPRVHRATTSLNQHMARDARGLVYFSNYI